MRESILGMLVGWTKAYQAFPFYTVLIGVGVAMAAVIMLGGWFRVRTYLKDQISGGPMLMISALVVLAICLLWTLLDGILYWADAPLLSERLIRALSPDSLQYLLTEEVAAGQTDLLREVLGSPEGPSTPLLPGGVSMALGLLLAGGLYYLIAALIGSTLSEMLSLQRKPEDILREERKKKLEAEARARAEAGDAAADGASGEPASAGSSVASQVVGALAPLADRVGVSLPTVDSAAGSPAGDGDHEEYDPETMGAPLPNDSWGRIYKMGGHFRSYSHVENRFLRWQKALSITFLMLLLLGALPAVTGYMPVPMWVATAILANAFWMLTPARKRKPEKADADDAKSAPTVTVEHVSVLPAFAERAEFSSHLGKAPSPPPMPAGGSSARVHAAQVLADITSALAIGDLYPHQAAAISAFDRRRSVLLATAPRSGRDVLTDALALYAVLADGERVLFIADTAERAISAQRRFDRRADATHWKWNVLAMNLAERAGTHDPSQSQPALLFADPRAVHRQLCGQSERWDTFLAGVGTIILPDIDRASGPRAAHLYHLFRRLHRAIRRARTVALGRDLLEGDTDRAGDPGQLSLRFAVTAHPGHGNLGRYVERIIGSAVTVVGPQQDGAPRPRQDARIVLSSLEVGGAHPALGLRDQAREMGYRPALIGYDELFTEGERDPSMTHDAADVLIVRHNPGTQRALPLDTMHLGSQRTSRRGQTPSVAVVWQPDPTPMARQWADALAAEQAEAEGDPMAASSQPSLGRALIASPGAPEIERSHLLATLAESEIEVEELIQVFSRASLLDVLGKLRQSGRLLHLQRRLLDPRAGEVITVDSVRMSTSEDVHASFGLATCGQPWFLCERATGDVLAQLEGVRARAAAYPMRVFVARGRRFEVLPDEVQDQLSRHRILCQQIDSAAVSAPIRTLFIKVVERRKPGGQSAVQPEHPATAPNPDRDASADVDQAKKPDEKRPAERRRGALRSMGGARFSLQHRDVVVTETMTGVRRFDLWGKELDTTFYDRPIKSEFRTQAAILGLIPEHLGDLEASIDTLHALAHGFSEALPSLLHYRPEEDLDIAPLARTDSWSTPSVVFVDLHPGGAGFAEAIGLDVVRQLCRHTLDLLCACPDECEQGCERCIHLWTCRAPGQHHQSTDKAAAMAALTALLGE